MIPVTISKTTLPSGLTVLFESMPDAPSVSVEILFPGGLTGEPEGCGGASLALAELMGRGAGGRSNRELAIAFDNLGTRYRIQAVGDRYAVKASMITLVFPEVLRLLGDLVLSPTLNGGELPAIKELLLQDLRGLKDSPAQWAMSELSARVMPPPFNRSALGTEEGIAACTEGVMRAVWRRSATPHGAIISIAGAVDEHVALAQIEQVFGAWRGESVARPTFGSMVERGVFSVAHPGNQTQVVMVYGAPPLGSPDAAPQKVAAALLSGGMFGRLFVEVREKRGLCYSVAARYSAARSYGLMTVYAGTTPQRAKETIAVIPEVLDSLRSTPIALDELQRAKAHLTSSLVLGQESSSARASGNALEFWHLDRCISLHESVEEIERVTAEDVQRVVERFTPARASLLTLGPVAGENV